MDSEGARVFLVRHGRTEWNRKQIFRGSSEVPLDKTGLSQADCLGRYFSAIPLRSIYTSKQSRALETAKAIAKQQPAEMIIAVDEGLNDIHRGEWEGLSHEDAKAEYPQLYAKWFHSPKEVRFPGGECLHGVHLRAWKAFDSIRHSAQGGAVALVSHHVVLRTILCGLFGLDLNQFRRFEVEPASVSEIRLEYGEWVLYRLNETCHLGKAR